MHVGRQAAVSRAAHSAHITAMTPQTEPAAQSVFLNLGELTDALAALPEGMPAFVMMGGELFSPYNVDTYRANGSDLAIEPASPTHRRTVGHLLGSLQNADGRTWIHRGKAVCVSGRSSSSEDYVTAVEVRSGAAVVVTEKITR